MARLSGIAVHDGSGENFWEVGFTPLQRSQAEVSTEDMRTATIHLDPETGEASLSEGWAPGSVENRDERALFAEYEDAIVDALLDDHRIRRDAPAFVARHATPEAEAARREAIDAVERALAGHEVDLEHADDGEDDAC